MPRLLVIVDLGHASPRFPGLCQELAKLGWEIDLITPRLSNNQKRLFLFSEIRNWNLVETPLYRMRYKSHVNSPIFLKLINRIGRKIVDFSRQLYRKLTFKAVEEFGYSDHAGWERHVNRALKILIKINKYDLLISSSSPITAHIVARNASAKFNIPWVADYRDPYSLNHTNPLGTNAQLFEASLIKSAVALSTASDGFARLHRAIYDGEIIVVNNGFKVLYPSRAVTCDEKINILYTGTIEKGHQNLELFLESIEQVNVAVARVEVTFVGSSCADVKDYYVGKSQEIPEYIYLRGNVSREESHALQRTADLLLYFEWGNSENDGVLATKLYEYVGSGSPILRVGTKTNDEASRIFESIGYLASLETSHEINERLMEILDSSRIENNRNDSAATYYSYASIASRLDKDLKRILGTVNKNEGREN